MTIKNKLKTYIDVDKSILKALPNTGTETFEFNITAPGDEGKYWLYTQEN